MRQLVAEAMVNNGFSGPASSTVATPHLHHIGLAFRVSNGRYSSLRNGC